MTHFIIHRINTISELASIPTQYGVEIDLRAEGSNIILQHEAFQPGQSFEEYLKHYKHGPIIANIKEAGIEDAVIKLLKTHCIQDYFLLDVEFPYIYRASRQGQRAIAIRYSEDESLETALHYAHKVDWIWIDTITQLPIYNSSTVESLKPFKTCLVCPERWGRPEDIITYAEHMNNLHFKPNAIMTSLQHVKTWQNALNKA